jgi:hypothetical protein
LSYKGISQIASDSTKIPNWQLKRAINIIENGKVVKVNLDYSNQKIKLQDSLLSLKDSTINVYVLKDSLYKSANGAYKRALKNLQTSLNNSEAVVNLQSIQIKKEKYKKWLTLIAGVGGGYLLFHK